MWHHDVLTCSPFWLPGDRGDSPAFLLSEDKLCGNNRPLPGSRLLPPSGPCQIAPNAESDLGCWCALLICRELRGSSASAQVTSGRSLQGLGGDGRNVQAMNQFLPVGSQGPARERLGWLQAGSASPLLQLGSAVPAWAGWGPALVNRSRNAVRPAGKTQMPTVLLTRGTVPGECREPACTQRSGVTLPLWWLPPFFQKSCGPC